MLTPVPAHVRRVRMKRQAKDKRLALGSILPQKTRFYIPAGRFPRVSVRNDHGFLRAKLGRKMLAV